MKDLDWIKDLVRAEQQMEESGVVEYTTPFDPYQALQHSTLNFLRIVKESFVEYTTAFNQLRAQPLGGIKIYGISRTEADFMLFRNGFKLIFSALEAGRISVRFQSQAGTLGPMADSANQSFDEDILEATWGAFGEIRWTFDKLEIDPDHLVRYYLQRFIKESAR